jgi:uncharacterized damage-inducible protein DinB
MKIAKLIRYNFWAGERTRKLLEKLTEEDFAAELPEPFAAPLHTVERIVNHISQGLQFALLILQGLSHSEVITRLKKKEEFKGKSVCKHWQEIDQKLLSTSESIKGTVDFPAKKGKKYTLQKEDIVFQFINHATYHRGRLMLALRQLNKETIGTDYLLYMRSKIE